MKKIWNIILMLVIALQVPAQTDIEVVKKYFPVKGSRIEYSEVIKLDSAFTSEILFKNAKQWIVDNFTYSKEVLETEDKESGYLIGKGYFRVLETPVGFFVTNSRIWFTIKIEVKDGRYKYTFYNIDYEYTVAGHADDKTRLEEYVSNNETRKAVAFYKAVDKEFKKTISTIKLRMGKIEREEW